MENNKAKVFGIGLNKTGTTTLGVCLNKLGYNVKDCDLKLLKYSDQKKMDPIYDTVKKYDGFQDWPWPLLYKELDRRFPGSKFILTTRKNSEAWFRSLKKHADRTGPTEHRKIVYGYEMPHEYKEHHIRIYKKHNKEVIDYFKNRKTDLLEACWGEGTGWKELCKFLGHKVPETVFPHANKSRSQIKASLLKFKSKWADFLNS